MSDSGTKPNSKVARVIERYGMEGRGDELEAAWTGEYGERTSLRDLAGEFNVDVLAAALRETGGTAIDSDIESTYHTLTDSDVPRADRMRKRRELEREGLDVDSVLSDFVTHQAIHTYLTEYRKAELPDTSENLLERKIETIERLQGRTAAVTESSVDSLVNADEITDRNYEILVDIRAVCTDCGTDYTLSDLLRDGGCDCGTVD